MADMLVRGISEETKRRLAEQANENGRSQNAEVLCILEEALPARQRTWFDILRQAAKECEGMDFEPPERHSFREFTFEADR